VNVVPPGAGETIRPGFEIKVARPELVLTEAVYAPGDHGPDPHVHHEHADSFFVLDGQLEWLVGPRLEAHGGPAGSFVSVPPDVLHTFHNPGPADARFLNLHAPGLGFERYLRGEFPEFDQHYRPEGSGLEATDVIVLGPGEGERLELGGSSATIKVGRDQLAVLELELVGDFPHPPPHRHAHTLEAFYVLDGQFGLTIEGEDWQVPADGCAAVPPGTVHTSPPSDPLTFLNVFAPGGVERYVREAARGGAPPPPDEYDIEFV
jgi:quercetin dioxygenase-like cupin family protein